MRKLELKDCISRFEKTHGKGRYDYSEVNYHNSQSKVIIICHQIDKYGQEHGKFKQKPVCHWSGQGCSKCANHYMDNDLFIKKSVEAHGKEKYNYELVDYKQNKSKVQIICNQCGKVFKQRPNDHLMGNGCYYCSKIYPSNNQKFIQDSIKVHGKEKYNYELVNYKQNKIKVRIICNQCNQVFEQRPNDHLQGLGCPFCFQSKGEKLIEQWLKNNCLHYIKQKSFKDCRNKLPLPFDFYLLELNICIEYDGKQHFKPVQFGGITEQRANQLFKETVFRDGIKTEYCKQNGIKLIRISYKDDIEEKLKEIVNG